MVSSQEGQVASISHASTSTPSPQFHIAEAKFQENVARKSRVHSFTQPSHRVEALQQLWQTENTEPSFILTSVYLYPWKGTQIYLDQIVEQLMLKDIAKNNRAISQQLEKPNSWV